MGLGWHGVSLIRPARRGPNSPLPAVAPRVGEGEVAASWEDGVRGAVWRAPIRHQPEPIAGEFPVDLVRGRVRGRGRIRGRGRG